MVGESSIDLNHIPRGSQAQNKLRQYFQYTRSRQQTSDHSQTKEDALIEAIDKVKVEFPGFEPEFDHSYFSLSGLPGKPYIKISGDGNLITSAERECVLISLCACGVPCRYHGLTHKMGRRLIKEKRVAELKSKFNVIPVCPDLIGGLPTPRCTCKVTWVGEEASVTNKKGEKEFKGTDLTEAYNKGAEWTLWMAKLFNCKKAYMLKGSPACDPKNGVASRLLSENGVTVIAI